MSQAVAGGRVPLIRLRRYLLVSIQVALSDRMVVQLREDIATALARSDLRGLIIDVSGIDVMDSYIVRALQDIGLIAQLMGVETAVCGIDPMIALTLVEMGIELKSVSTARDLDLALLQLDARVETQSREDDELLKELVGVAAGRDLDEGQLLQGGRQRDDGDALLAAALGAKGT